ITSEVPTMKRLSREARKRRNKRLKWEQIENGASYEPEDDVTTESPTELNDIVLTLRI
ncbi:2831_t:CDS:1, partial [Funneliformis mosseae]